MRPGWILACLALALAGGCAQLPERPAMNAETAASVPST